MTMTTSEFLGYLDKAVAAAINNSPDKPCCSKGCHHCCDEPLYVDKREMEHMLEGYPAEKLEGLKQRLLVWLEKAKPLLTVSPDPRTGLLDAFAWRDAKITCPFLEGGLCSVYERRPMGCRMFLALGNPDNCAMPMRKKQLIAEHDWSWPGWKTLMEAWLGSTDMLTMDHLGVMMAKQLLGLDVPSSVTINQPIEVIDEEQ